IELETTIKDLSSLLADGDFRSDNFSSADSVEKQEILDLMVFNYLHNSRADDGFSYWENSGWKVDPLNGFSGPASFKVDGEKGKTKTIKQTIYPSHRNDYSISFRAFAKDLKKGDKGRVGINVKVTYEDGSTGNQFIPLT